MKKIIKCWKVIDTKLDSITAFKVFKNRVYEDKRYDVMGIRLGWKTFQSGLDNLDNAQFTAHEILSNNWELLIPDNDMESILEKMRQMYKDEHLGDGLNYRKIDNMSIEDLWNHLVGIMNNLDDKNKYRIAKWIIENKIYKKV